jgi:2-haloalkanoic acid dehalogenase type II
LGKKPVARAGIFSGYVALEASEEKGYKPYRDVLEETSLKLARVMGLEPSESAAAKFAESITRWPAFEDTAPTLKKLGTMGYKRVILSNIDKNLLRQTIRNNHLEVDAFITAQDVKSYKPEKRNWAAFLTTFKAKRDEVLHVASSIYHDITPANELGLKTVWVNRYGESLPRKVKPSFIVDRLSSLLGILDKK